MENQELTPWVVYGSLTDEDVTFLHTVCAAVHHVVLGHGNNTASLYSANLCREVAQVGHAYVSVSSPQQETMLLLRFGSNAYRPEYNPVARLV